MAFPLETVTVAKLLGESGYKICITGKWHLGSKPQFGPNHFGFHHSYGSWRAVRKGDWKLIVFSVKNAAEERIELFNLEEDPNETTSLAESNPEKVRELRAELEAEAAADQDSVASGDRGV